MSISMVVQNFSPIRCFLHNKQPPKVRRKIKEKKKKKKVGKPIGDPVGGRDAPINNKHVPCTETQRQKKTEVNVHCPKCCYKKFFFFKFRWTLLNKLLGWPHTFIWCMYRFYRYENTSQHAKQPGGSFQKIWSLDSRLKLPITLATLDCSMFELLILSREPMRLASKLYFIPQQTWQRAFLVLWVSVESAPTHQTGHHMARGVISSPIADWNIGSHIVDASWCITKSICMKKPNFCIIVHQQTAVFLKFYSSFMTWCSHAMFSSWSSLTQIPVLISFEKRISSQFFCHPCASVLIILPAMSMMRKVLFKAIMVFRYPHLVIVHQVFQYGACWVFSHCQLESKVWSSKLYDDFPEDLGVSGSVWICLHVYFYVTFLDILYSCYFQTLKWRVYPDLMPETLQNKRL